MSSENFSLFTDEKFLIAAFHGLGCVLAILPTLMGVGIGLVQGSGGICKAADYSVDIIHAIIPMCFITAPAVFSLIMFFVNMTSNPENIRQSLKLLLSGVICGIGNCYAAHCIGTICRSAAVTKAQQKRFNGSFLVMMIFGEIIALFSLLCGIILKTNPPDKV
ncbi:hypothetical protein NAPIS_ORF00876 [Vairimorpha apis BRL 01]|uniref:V-ATPase proteolipid subunit C-like domain-containing protein n=1 Tax=Vairimorpha apis BRL 01 TaxID=1037528 RepID=T0LB88_9MICR|nr:hypothetical protein NAPIS_ORF00876 [Vairimorpha apis BRL 01]